MKRILVLSLSVACLTLGVTAVSTSSAFATEGTVPAQVQEGIDNATAAIGALDGLSLAALTVALTPLGAMLTLRFLNMVLSRV